MLLRRAAASRTKVVWAKSFPAVERLPARHPFALDSGTE
jgi:hypothetical protein